MLDLFLKISIIILVGLLGGRIAKKFGLPSVSGYIVAGLLLGPSFIDLVSNEGLNSLGFITDIALAAIAFSIGNEFLLSDMKKVGNKIFLLTIAEVIGALVIVFMTMYFLFNQSFEFSIVIAYAITGSRALRTASRLGVIVHMTGGILGILIMAALAVLGTTALLTPANILLYQLVWMIPGLIVTFWTRTI